jgi:hypothetical protein
MVISPSVILLFIHQFTYHYRFARLRREVGGEAHRVSLCGVFQIRIWLFIIKNAIEEVRDFALKGMMGYFATIG